MKFTNELTIGKVHTGVTKRRQTNGGHAAKAGAAAVCRGPERLRHRMVNYDFAGVKPRAFMALVSVVALLT